MATRPLATRSAIVRAISSVRCRHSSTGPAARLRLAKGARPAHPGFRLRPVARRRPPRLAIGLRRQLGRRKDEPDALVVREDAAALLEHGTHVLARFPDLGVGETDGREAGNCVGVLHLDVRLGRRRSVWRAAAHLDQRRRRDPPRGIVRAGPERTLVVRFVSSPRFGALISRPGRALRRRGAERARQEVAQKLQSRVRSCHFLQ